MEIVKIISEHKRLKVNRTDGRNITRVKPGMKRVQAIVKIKGEGRVTRHIDIPKK